jgi:superfamily II DNA or RNA helicase
MNGSSSNGAKPDSFLDLPLPLALEGEPRKVAEVLLFPLFDLADTATLVCIASDSESVALASCGASKVLPRDCPLNLVLILPNGTDSLSTSSWRHISVGSPNFERLAFLNHLVLAKRLTLTVASHTSFPRNGEVLARLKHTSYLAVLVDRHKHLVEIDRFDLPVTKSAPQVRYECHWSYGDPTHRVLRLHNELAGLVAAPSSTGQHRLISEFVSFLSAFSPLPEPWTEPFGDEATLGISLYDHQVTAVEEWFRRDCRGIFKMCTGAGKTFTSLAVAWRWAKGFKDAKELIPPVIVSVPTRVLADQWCKEICKLGFAMPTQAYQSVNQYFDVLEPCLEFYREASPAFIVTTYRTFADARFHRVIDQLSRSGKHAMWIADEMHNLASPRLLELMQSRNAYFRWRIGLSATPEIEGEPDKTETLMAFFGGLAATYELRDAIEAGVLCNYTYHPCPCYLNSELGDQYLELLRQIDIGEHARRIDINLYREKRDLIRRAGVQVSAFAELLPQLMANKSRLEHTLVYCPPGYRSSADERAAEEIDETAEDKGDKRLLDDIICLLRRQSIEVASILGETTQARRSQILLEFASGRLQVVCAIGCLDEGVDVPSIRRAVVLYSVDREKQFIQRRGRILRRSTTDSPKIAEIYDIIILPQGSQIPALQCEALLNKELRRYHEFAKLALNQADADAVISSALSVATRFLPPHI